MKSTLIFVFLYLLLSYLMAYSIDENIVVFSILFLILTVIFYTIYKVKRFKSIRKLSVSKQEDFLKNEFISLYSLIIFFMVFMMSELPIPDSLTAVPGLYFLIGLPIHIFFLYEEMCLIKFRSSKNN